MLKEHPGELLAMVTKIKFHQETFKMRLFLLIFTFSEHTAQAGACINQPGRFLLMNITLSETIPL